jgi:cellulose synthase/poly-beta-1,6-N-acetylglucosamine synthase-like glycosyltransferase
MVARQAGAMCLERSDLSRRGKGPALQWAFDQILEKPFDAIVVLDADCVLDLHALRVFDAEYEAGHKVLQANCVAGNPDDSATSYITALANRLENHFFYIPKSRIRMPVILRGTGMVLGCEVLRAHPWAASSLVEDGEYTLSLYRAGIFPRYVEDVNVTTPFPIDARQLKTQRLRWIGGALHYVSSQSLRFISNGLRTGNLHSLDLGWSTLIMIRSLVCVLTILTLFTASLVAWLTQSTFSWWLLVVSLAAGLGLFAYVVIGVIDLGINRRRLIHLWGLPLVAARMLAIMLTSVMGHHHSVWSPTPRDATAATRT